MSSEGILHLQNPNSGKRILDARILMLNFWVDFFAPCFLQQRRPRKIHPQKIHLPKFTYKFNQKMRPKLLQGHLVRQQVTQKWLSPTQVTCEGPKSERRSDFLGHFRALIATLELLLTHVVVTLTRLRKLCFEEDQ